MWAHGIEVWDEVRADRVEALRRAEIVLVNSAYTRERADPTLGGLRDVRVCPLGSYTDEPAPPRAPAAGPPTVLLLGRVEPGWPKGQGVLTSLWPRVVATVPDARLLLVGKGPALEALRELARNSPAASRIEVAGFVPEAEIEAVWRRATVFAMPSLTEGFGLVFIEAMRRGLPVIASRADAGREVNVDGETGFTLERSDEDAIVDGAGRTAARARPRRCAGRGGRGALAGRVLLFRVRAPAQFRAGGIPGLSDAWSRRRPARVDLASARPCKLLASARMRTSTCK